MLIVGLELVGRG